MATKTRQTANEAKEKAMRGERWEMVIVVSGNTGASVQTWIGSKKETEDRAARFARNPNIEVVVVRKSA